MPQCVGNKISAHTHKKRVSADIPTVVTAIFPQRASCNISRLPNTAMAAMPRGDTGSTAARRYCYCAMFYGVGAISILAMIGGVVCAFLPPLPSENNVPVVDASVLLYVVATVFSIQLALGQLWFAAALRHDGRAVAGLLLNSALAGCFCAVMARYATAAAYGAYTASPGAQPPHGVARSPTAVQFLDRDVYGSAGIRLPRQ